MNIILIGYRGSGKSAVGRKLALHLSMKFVDIDDLIVEREAASIDQMVKSKGWDYFRKLEKSVIEEISEEDNLVIAPGGGAVLDADNVQSLKKNSFVVWLKADHDVLHKRIAKDPETARRRPSLTNGKKGGTLEEIEEVLSARRPFYEKASDSAIETSGLDVDGVVEKVLEVVKRSS